LLVLPSCQICPANGQVKPKIVTASKQLSCSLSAKGGNMKNYILLLFVLFMTALPQKAYANNADIWNKYMFGCLPVDSCCGWPWGFGTSEIPADATFDEICGIAVRAARGVWGMTFRIRKDLGFDSYGCLATDDTYVKTFERKMFAYACVIEREDGSRYLLVELYSAGRGQNGERPLFPTGYPVCSPVPQ
jgi:hypothetical protein